MSESPIQSKVSLTPDQLDDLFHDMQQDLLKSKRRRRVHLIVTCALAVTAGTLVFQIRQQPSPAMATPTPANLVTQQPPTTPYTRTDPQPLGDAWITGPQDLAQRLLPEPDMTLWESSHTPEPTSTTSTNGYRPSSSTSTSR